MENNTLERVSTTVTGEPVEITVSISPRNWLHEKLQNCKPVARYFPKERRFTIHPVKLGSLVRISKLLLSIDKHALDKDNILESNYQLAIDHAGTVARIIAIAIHNRKSRVPESLVQLIIQEFAPHELMGVLMIVLKQLDLQSFMSSIISIRGLNVLESHSASAKSANGKEVSPMDQGR